MSGLAQISMVEIDAWQRVHHIKLSSWELEMIEVFDRIAIEVSNSKGSK